MGRGFRKGVGGGGNKAKYHYELVFPNAFGSVTLTKIYNGQVIYNKKYFAHTEWGQNFYQDECIRIQSYNDGTNVWERVYSTANITVNGVIYPKDAVIWQFTQGGASFIYEIERYEPKKKWLYKAGDECIDITGGWRNMNINQTPMRKLASALELYTDGSATQNRRGYAFTINKVDVTKAFRLGVKMNGVERYVSCASLTGEYLVCAGRHTNGWGGEASSRFNVIGLPPGYIDPSTNNWLNCAFYSGAPSDINDITEVWLEE